MCVVDPRVLRDAVALRRAEPVDSVTSLVGFFVCSFSQREKVPGGRMRGNGAIAFEVRSIDAPLVRRFPFVAPHPNPSPDGRGARAFRSCSTSDIRADASPRGNA